MSDSEARDPGIVRAESQKEGTGTEGRLWKSAGVPQNVSYLFVHTKQQTVIKRKARTSAPKDLDVNLHLTLTCSGISTVKVLSSPSLADLTCKMGARRPARHSCYGATQSNTSVASSILLTIRPLPHRFFPFPRRQNCESKM